MDLVELEARAQCVLSLKYHICGVRILRDEAAYDQAAARTLKGHLPYCVTVRSALHGHAVKTDLAHFGCKGSIRALGLVAPTEDYLSGEAYCTMGLYDSRATGARAVDIGAILPFPTHGVMVKPLSMYRQDEAPPDVVLIVGDSYDMMRIAQGYSYSFGPRDTYKMSGLQAFCSECTAHPMLHHQLNFSLLCSGTRYVGHWDRNDLACGIPFDQFEETVAGIYATVNPLERDAGKRRIEQRLAAAALTEKTDLRIEYGRNYDDSNYLHLRSKNNK